MEYAEQALQVIQDFHLDNIAPLGKVEVATALYYLGVSSIAGITMCIIVSALLTSRLNPKGKHVVVTGGSSGIGLAVAVKYAKMGANVTLVARNMKKLEDAKKKVIEAIGFSSNKCHVISLDTSSGQDSVTKAWLLRQPERGCGHSRQLCRHEYRRHIRLNRSQRIYSHVQHQCYGQCLPHTRIITEMKKNKNGTARIVFVSSQVAQCALHGYTAYASSKWALRGIAEALQRR